MSATINAANFLMLSVFGIAAVGYLLGRITIKGISLGTAGVFVIALIYGAFSERTSIPNLSLKRSTTPRRR